MSDIRPGLLHPEDSQENLDAPEPMIGADPSKLVVYNSLTRTKEPFEPLVPGKVSMYVCGVTVYDLTHIGHARTFISFDVVSRYIRALGFDLKFVRNHTDVDDKIIQRANELGEEPLALSQRFIQALEEDMGALGVGSADVEPLVSTHIPQITGLIQKLIDADMAYAAPNGDVYYRVDKFEGYGKLSGQKLEALRAGERIATDPNKDNPHDFALWKSSKPGEPFWESPWGNGRPGWHIECSAMSMCHLGETFDIHGGGSDLQFPHHENEIAQSEGATGCTYARYWMHGGMVNVVKEDSESEIVEKMSKSLGNFWTVRDVLQAYHPEVVRYFMLTTHYRQPITYSIKMMEEAHGRLEYLYTTLQRINEALGKAPQIPEKGKFVAPAASILGRFFEDFHTAMSDDFNAPAALVPLGELAKAANELTKSPKKPKPDVAYTLAAIRSCLVQAGAPLGLLQTYPADALHSLRDKKAKALGIDKNEIEALIVARAEARASKDWARADEVRNELSAKGIELMDGVDGTDWRIAKVV